MIRSKLKISFQIKHTVTYAQNDCKSNITRGRENKPLIIKDAISTTFQTCDIDSKNNFFVKMVIREINCITPEMDYI